MLRERGQTQKNKYYLILFVWNFITGETSDRKQVSDCPRWKLPVRIDCTGTPGSISGWRDCDNLHGGSGGYKVVYNYKMYHTVQLKWVALIVIYYFNYN